VGGFTVYSLKEVRTQIGSHVEEDHGTLDLTDRETAFALFEECIRYSTETGDERVAPIIQVFLDFGYYWVNAAPMVENMRPIVEKKKEDNAAAAIELQSQDEIDYQNFIETGVLPKWFLLEDIISPEPDSPSFKRLPGKLYKSIIDNPKLLRSQELIGDMQVLMRSIEFEPAAPSKHWSATADPYLKLWGCNKSYHLEKPIKTSIINNSLAPAWKELNLTFESRATWMFRYNSIPETLVIEVWNDNRFKDDIMATAVIDATHLAAIGLRRLCSLNDKSANKVDLVVQVDFSYAEATRFFYAPNKYHVMRFLHDSHAPEKRVATINVQLTFDSTLVEAAFREI
jgi:hypothetical protein